MAQHSSTHRGIVLSSIDLPVKLLKTQKTQIENSEKMRRTFFPQISSERRGDAARSRLSHPAGARSGSAAAVPPAAVRFYKRYNAKKNKRGVMKTLPAGAIPCDAPDPVTGRWPHWVPVEPDSPADHWFIVARENTPGALPARSRRAAGIPAQIR